MVWVGVGPGARSGVNWFPPLVASRRKRASLQYVMGVN